VSRRSARARFGTDTDGYQAMLAAGRRHKDREWALEGCSGIGRHVAQRLVADGETVVDVPAKLSARSSLAALRRACPASRPASCWPLSGREGWSVRPARRLASELIHELVVIDKKIKIAPVKINA
jgi:hypothetical protein